MSYSPGSPPTAMADPGLPCPTCRDLRTIRPA